MKSLGQFFMRHWHVADKWLLFLWLGASGASLLFLYGVYHSGFISGGNLITQTGAIGLGFVGANILMRIDYNLLLKLWRLYLPLCVALVLLVFSPMGVEVNGNRAWLALSIAGRDFTVQPSEFLKISFVTTLALHLQKVGERLNEPLHVLLLCLHGAAHVLLVQTQDSGTALVFFLIFLVVVFAAGLAWKYIAAAGGAIAVGAPLLWFFVLTENQKMRFRILFDYELDPDRIFQQMRSAAALSTGGMQGTGILAGSHVFVPYQGDDFIFSFIGESVGFVGCLGVIALLCAIAFKILWNAGGAKDTAGRCVCIGIFAIIAVQTVINIGMCVVVTPVIGVPLPLISAGGSSVLALYGGLGLVLSVRCHSNTALFYER